MVGNGKRNIHRINHACTVQNFAALFICFSQYLWGMFTIIEDGANLLFHQSTFFLNHQQMTEAITGCDEPLRLQRPAHSDFIQPQAQRLCPCLVNAQIRQCLKHIHIGFACADNPELCR